MNVTKMRGNMRPMSSLAAPPVILSAAKDIREWHAIHLACRSFAALRMTDVVTIQKSSNRSQPELFPCIPRPSPVPAMYARPTHGTGASR